MIATNNNIFSVCPLANTKLVSLSSGPVLSRSGATRRGNVAVVRLSGIMIKGSSIGGADTRAVQREVRIAAADPDVSGIMLLIDSPGGSVDGLAELGDTVASAARSKPVVAQADGMIASAAYYVASQADAIYAQRMDMVGSLGARLLLYDYSQMFKNEGVEAVPVDTGAYKSAGATGTPITRQQRADYQRIVDAFGNDFRRAIMRGRGMTASRVGKVFDGRIWTAKEAKALGLIDGIASPGETFAKLQQASTTPQRYRAERRLQAAGIDQVVQVVERTETRPALRRWHHDGKEWRCVAV